VRACRQPFLGSAMKKIKEIVTSYLVGAFLTYVAVIIFMGFGPVFIDGDLAILKTNKYTLIGSLVMFWPVYFVRMYRARKR
jgi:hypothetical protein